MKLLRLAILLVFVPVILLASRTSDPAQAGSPGCTILVDSTGDDTLIDTLVTLREAIAFATDVFGPTPGELDEVSGCPGDDDNPGALRNDMVVFDAAVFPTGSPATITLTGPLPPLSTSFDGVFAIGRGVIVDGVVDGFDCITMTSIGNLIAGLQVTGCSNGVLVDGTSLNASSNRVGDAVAGGNVIRGNGTGVRITGANATNNVVAGNKIGTDVSGAFDAGNNAEGVVVFGSPSNVIGGTAAGARNTISGNGTSGVWIREPASTGNLVQGNYIGLNAAGTAPLNNAQNGVLTTVNASATTVGGTVAGAGNVISGNQSYGIQIFSSEGNLVQGNQLGTNAAGTAAIPNAFGVGVIGSSSGIIGGTTAAHRNVISGNSTDGVVLGGFANGVRVEGNYIGTRPDGVTPLGNGRYGVNVFSTSNGNVIGGPGASNLIANNTQDGVYVEVGINNEITQNSIHSNGGLGIDLGANGVTPNDAGDGDSGPNNLQNFPVINSLFQDGSLLDIGVSLNSTANTTFTFEFYYSTACNFGGYGEGATYIGATSASTNGSGNTSFFTGFSVTPPAGAFVTATAKDVTNKNTSEFSAGLAMPGGVATDGDCDGVSSVAETNCGGDPLNPLRRPERLDGIFAGVDDDGDTSIDEALPAGVAAYDCDGDGYKGSAEANVTTNDQDSCGTNGWPSDIVPSVQVNTLNIADLGSFIAPVRRYGTSVGHPDFNVRWDLVPGSVAGAHINTQDIVATFVGASGYPPMLGGQRALGQVCPWVP